MFTNHNTIRGIVNSITLNTISIDRANYRFTNASVYLFVYPLDIYHVPSRFNFVPDVLSRLQASGDNAVHQDEEAEPVLDDIWEEGDIFDPIFLLCFKV